MSGIEATSDYQTERMLVQKVPKAEVATHGPEPDGAAYLVFVRIALARASILSASLVRAVSRSCAAWFSKLMATSGCSGPRAFSLIVSERL